MMRRDKAFALVKERFGDNVNLIRHILAVGAVMQNLARRLGEDEEMWAVVGLIHDLDYPQTMDDPQRHARLTCAEMEGKLSTEMLNAILVHAGHKAPTTKIDWALYAADPVTGLITAGVLMHPSRRIRNYTLQSLKKRFKDKRFAAGASREQIASCVNLGLNLDEFLQLALDAMSAADESLGL